MKICGCRANVFGESFDAVPCPKMRLMQMRDGGVRDVARGLELR